MSPQDYEVLIQTTGLISGLNYSPHVLNNLRSLSSSNEGNHSGITEWDGKGRLALDIEKFSIARDTACRLTESNMDDQNSQ